MKEFQASVKSGDVFRNPQDGSRMVVEGVDTRSDDTPIVYATEYGSAPGHGILHERRIIPRPLHNFLVHTRMQDMKGIDPIQDREPLFYEAYERQVEILGNAFAREFFACEQVLDAWEKKLVALENAEETVLSLIRIQLFRQRMDEIADEWEKTDTTFIRGGHRCVSLFSELKKFSATELDSDKELAQWKRVALVRLSKEYGSDDPDHLLIERGYFRDVLQKKVERLFAKCRQVKSKRLRISDEVTSLPSFEREVQQLADAVVGYDSRDTGKESTVAEIRKILDTLDNMDVVAFRMEDDTDETNSKPRISRKKKMRLSDTGDAREKTTTKGTPKRGRVPKSDRFVVVDAGAPVVESVVASEKTSDENGVENGNSDPSVDFGHLLVNAVAGIEMKIFGAQNREDISFISFSTLKDGTKVFVEMSEENGLREIYKKLIRADKKQEAFQLKKQWTEENHRLEMEYLKKKLIVEILAVGSEVMARIDRASSSKELQHVGRIIRTQNSSERVFIPTDPRISASDPSETEDVRLAIQDMIELWRGERIPKQGKWKNFEDYFQKEFSSLIMDSNNQIRKAWEKKRATFPKEGEKKSLPRKNRKEMQGKSTELVDVYELRQKAQQDIQTLLERSLRFIEAKLSEQGTNFLEIYKTDRPRAQGLLSKVAENVVLVAAHVAQQVKPEDADALKQAVIQFGTEALSAVLKKKVAGLLTTMQE